MQTLPFSHSPILPFLIGGWLLMILSASGVMASVPAPYTSVKASAGEFRCLGRTTKLGPMLLPTQITSAGRALLQSPIRIVTEPASAMNGITGKGRLVSNDGDSAVWEWHGESSAFKIEIRMTGDCDGLMWYDMTFSPKKPVELSSLRLEIPRCAETARYVHSANFRWGEQMSRGLAEIGGAWKSGFMPYAWLGDEDRGLAWCCETDQGSRLNDPANALSAQTDGGAVVFRARVLDHAETIDSPISLKFGFQATPVKPVSFAWRAKARIYHGVNYESDKTLLDNLKDAGVKTVVFHDMWPEYYGQLKPEDEPGLRKLISECHKRGMRILVYIGYGVARNAPEMQVKGHHDEWSIMPLIPWIPGYKPEYRTFDATCARSGWQDWLVSGIDKLFADYELDGLYFDGTTEAFRCENQSHGCGWRDGKGGLHAGYPLLDVRRMMRRISDVVRKHRPNAIFDAHMSTSLTMPTLSLCDSYWDGEQYEHYTRTDKVEIPLDAFPAEFMGWAHGIDAEFLCYTDRPFTMEEAVTVAWLHGVEVRPGNPDQLAVVSPIWRAMDRFGVPSAKWLPYWKGSGVAADDPSVKASVWAKDGRALIFVSHLKREPLPTLLRLDRAKLGLTSEKLAAVDAITGEALKPAGDSLPIDFPGMTYRVIEVR